MFDNMNPDQKSALMQGLLAAGLGMLANNQGRNKRAALANAFGGAIPGFAVYQGALERSMRQRQEDEKRQRQKQQDDARESAIASLPEQYQPIARAGLLKEAWDKANPQIQYTQQWTNGPDGRPQLTYVPNRPMPGVDPVSVQGLSKYDANLDPNIRTAKIEDRVNLERAIQPFAMERARASASKNSFKIENLPDDKRFDWERDLRKDYTSDVKAYREVADAHRIIKGALANPSPANDMAAATKFMKLLDPGSVVRESELAMAMQASGMWDRMTNYAQMIVSGQKLTPQQRKDFAEAADLIFSGVDEQWKAIDASYDERAKRYNLDSDRIRSGLRPKQAEKPASNRSRSDILKQYGVGQ